MFYQNKTEIVEAFQYDGNNWNEICDKAFFDWPPDECEIKEGEYLVLHRRGHRFLPKENFEREYKPLILRDANVLPKKT